MKIPDYSETLCPLCEYDKICNHKRFKTKKRDNYTYSYCEKYTRKGEIDYENNRQNNG